VKSQLQKGKQKGPIYLSYSVEVFLKMSEIEAKSVRFGHPNEQVSTKSAAVLRETLSGWAIYSPTFVALLSFRVTNLLTKRLGIQRNDLSLVAI
jgi:hypothetical protein